MRACRVGFGLLVALATACGSKEAQPAPRGVVAPGEQRQSADSPDSPAELVPSELDRPDEGPGLITRAPAPGVAEPVAAPAAPSQAQPTRAELVLKAQQWMRGANTCLASLPADVRDLSLTLDAHVSFSGTATRVEITGPGLDANTRSCLLARANAMDLDVDLNSPTRLSVPLSFHR